MHFNIDGEIAEPYFDALNTVLDEDQRNGVGVVFNYDADSVVIYTKLRKARKVFEKATRLNELAQKQWPPVTDYETFKQVVQYFDPEDSYVFVFKMILPVDKMEEGQTLSGQDCEIEFYWYGFLPYDPKTELHITYCTEKAQLRFEESEEGRFRCRFSCSGHVTDDTGLGYEGDDFTLIDGFLDLKYPQDRDKVYSSYFAPDRDVKLYREQILKYKQEYEGY